MKYSKRENFEPQALGRSLCMDFEAVRQSFALEPDQRVKGALSGYIYDMPQFPGDRVEGGIHYANYVRLPTSLIPQKQPPLLHNFAQKILPTIEHGASFFDLGPGPEWSVRRNTVPALAILQPSCYVPVDLEPEFTDEACQVVAQEFPEMTIQKLAINFHRETLPPPKTQVSIVWYPGSTIGNLPSLPGQAFIENNFVVNHLKLLQQSDHEHKHPENQVQYLVVLVDSKKDDVQAMLDLYASSDAIGCFRSILFKLQRDLKAVDFDPEAFHYEPRWNPQSSAVEHTFTAKQAQTFKIYDCFTDTWDEIQILDQESYVLANSLKPSCDDMQAMLMRSGWQHLQSDQDDDQQFHIHLARFQH